MPSARSARINSHAERSRRIESGRRLVEEHEVGVAHERDAEVEPALLAARQRLHSGVSLLDQPHEVDDLVDVTRLCVVPGEEDVGLPHCQER